MKIVKGLAHALSYLHHDCSPPIVHRDVSLYNILLESELEPRLSDFGTARLLSTESSNWTNVAGSYGYMAPGTFFISPSYMHNVLSLSMLNPTRFFTLFFGTYFGAPIKHSSITFFFIFFSLNKSLTFKLLLKNKFKKHYGSINHRSLKMRANSEREEGGSSY